MECGRVGWSGVGVEWGEGWVGGWSGGGGEMTHNHNARWKEVGRRLIFFPRKKYAEYEVILDQSKKCP